MKEVTVTCIGCERQECAQEVAWKRLEVSGAEVSYGLYLCTDCQRLLDRSDTWCIHQARLAIHERFLVLVADAKMREGVSR